MADDFGDDDDTVIELEPDENVTPIDIVRCAECGGAIFDDDFDQMALAIGLDRCVRSKPGAERPWHWCANYSPTHDKFVELVPKKR